MADELLRAVRLEAIMPVIMRALFPSDHEDPLSGVTLNQLRLLRLLYNAPHPSSDAARELGMSISALTQLADRLTETGLIERSCDTQDRRVKLLRLSEQGSASMASRCERRATRAAAVLHRLSDTEQLQLMTVLERLLAVSRETPLHPSPESDADVEQRSPRKNP